MRNLTKSVFGLATAGFLVVGLAACSTPAETPSSSSSAAPSASASATTEADPTPLASIPTLTGVDTQVTLDSGFTGALTTLGLTPGVIGTATLDGATGVLAFPITGGNVDYYDPEMDYRPYVQGEIDHDGSGISLTAGDTVVKLTDFVIDPGTSRLTGSVQVGDGEVMNDVYIFNLDGTTLNPLQMEGDNAVLEGTTVKVSPDAAALLNSTFGTDAVTDELVVGIAKITVNTK
ncbi:hypothetical protein CMsap09_12890 [Clavibacter michiganensis]|uniref:Lipoprotein n=1 Tax=Clavibacter michiganensis TaxID=28447 RepID=A0A251XPI4_9MICO|nr:hypothetical protein CMsap09_00430 [Clavibacter michiganensis]OUE09836.1 hypothetical protein CMsap09_12890 [Clavibacter michiganensis]